MPLGFANRPSVTDDAAVAPLSVGEILSRLDRRLAWYGLPQAQLHAVEMGQPGKVVATLSVAGNGTFREVLDPLTGAVLARSRISQSY
jgi:hypothetical protein